jgi:hypothetical protein
VAGPGFAAAPVAATGPAGFAGAAGVAGRTELAFADAALADAAARNSEPAPAAASALPDGVLSKRVAAAPADAGDAGGLGVETGFATGFAAGGALPEAGLAAGGLAAGVVRAAAVPCELPAAPTIGVSLRMSPGLSSACTRP